MVDFTVVLNWHSFGNIKTDVVVFLRCIGERIVVCNQYPIHA